MVTIRPAALILLICVASVTPAQSLSTAPEIKLKDLRGRPLKVSDYRGKILLINFWATWCIPCRAEIPDLLRLQRQYRHRGLRVIGVAYPPQTRAEVRRFVRRLRINYPIALGTEATKALFDNSGVLPVTVVIDRDGMVREVIKGVLYHDEFDERIKPLLNERPKKEVRPPLKLKSK